MAKSPTKIEAAAFDPAQIDTRAEYDVTLAKPIQYGAANLLPIHAHTMTGAFLALIVKEFGAEVIHDATRRQ
jgi:hypothetical protein